MLLVNGPKSDQLPIQSEQYKASCSKSLEKFFFCFMQNGFDVLRGELKIWQLSDSYALDAWESLAQDGFKSGNRA